MSPPVGVLFVEHEIEVDDLQHGERRSRRRRSSAVRYRAIRSLVHGASSQSTRPAHDPPTPIRLEQRPPTGGIESARRLAPVEGSLGRRSARRSSSVMSARHCFTPQQRHYGGHPRVIAASGHQATSPVALNAMCVDDAHAEPAGAQRADAEHQPEHEQSRVLDPAEVDERRRTRRRPPRPTPSLSRRIDRALQQAAVHQLLDDRRADDDDQRRGPTSQPPWARSYRSRAFSLDASSAERVRPAALAAASRRAHQHELGEHADRDADEVDRA